MLRAIATSRSYLALNHYALIGTWRLVEGRAKVLARSEGAIRFHALAGGSEPRAGAGPGTPPQTAEWRWTAGFADHHHRPTRSLHLGAAPTASTRWCCEFTAAAPGRLRLYFRQ